jgi:hypothetical protein
MPLLAALWLLQSAVSPPHLRSDRAELRTGLDSLYAGRFAVAARYFAALGAADRADPAPPVFEAGAYIWWAAAQDSDDFASDRIDSLLDLAIDRARALAQRSPGPDADFWLGTALGYRGRERDLHGHSWGAAKDAKAMRDAYRRVLAADSSCADCWLGLGLYSYGLARAGTVAKIVARIVGLGGGNAADGIAMMRRSATSGDLARVEATWVLASALLREADRDQHRRGALREEARALVSALAQRYPGNAVFRRFLEQTVPGP